MSDFKSTSQGRSLLLNLIFYACTHCEDSSVEKMKHLLTESGNQLKEFFKNNKMKHA
jgi:hypothetical protein